MMVAYKCETPTDFVLTSLKKIKPSDLLGSLLSLPFNFVLQILPLMDSLLQQNKNIELVCKCVNFLLKIHHGEITSSPGHAAVVSRLKDHMAYNMAGLSFLRKSLEESKNIQLFADATAN